MAAIATTQKRSPMPTSSHFVLIGCPPIQIDLMLPAVGRDPRPAAIVRLGGAGVIGPTPEEAQRLRQSAAKARIAHATR